MKTDRSSIRQLAETEAVFHPFRWYLCQYFLTMAFLLAALAVKRDVLQAVSGLLPERVAELTLVVLFVAALVWFVNHFAPFVFVWSLKLKTWRTGAPCHAR